MKTQMSAAMFRPRSTIFARRQFGGVEHRRGGLRVGSAGTDRHQAVLRFDHVAVAGQDQRGLRSATTSSASRRRSMRSVRQSLASSTAARVRLPECFSSLPLEALEQGEGVRGCAPQTGQHLALYDAAHLARALPFITVLPIDTWPSPPITTCRHGDRQDGGTANCFTCVP